MEKEKLSMDLNFFKDNEIQLKSEELKKLGEELSDILPSMELISQLCDISLLLNMNEKDVNFSIIKNNKAFGVIYDQMEKVTKTIDKVAFILSVCTDKKELEGFKNGN